MSSTDIFFPSENRRLVWCFVALVWIFSATISAHGSDRFAFVVGNSDYTESPKLRNAVSDANAVAEGLQRLGFQVQLKTDLTATEFDQEFDQFCEQLPADSVALFFFAGHGIGIEEGNFILPIGHGIKSRATIRRKAINVHDIIAGLTYSRSNLKIVVLDACRDDPFEQSFSRTISASTFSQVTAPKGTIVAFSTAPGTEALDGEGDNSPYTEGLIQSLDNASRERVEVLNLFRQASRLCSEKTGQEPYLRFSASMPDYFLGKTSVPVASVVPSTPTPISQLKVTERIAAEPVPSGFLFFGLLACVSLAGITAGIWAYFKKTPRALVKSGTIKVRHFSRQILCCVGEPIEQIDIRQIAPELGQQGLRFECENVPEGFCFANALLSGTAVATGHYSQKIIALSGGSPVSEIEVQITVEDLAETPLALAAHREVVSVEKAEREVSLCLYDLRDCINEHGGRQNVRFGIFSGQRKPNWASGVTVNALSGVVTANFSRSTPREVEVPFSISTPNQSVNGSILVSLRSTIKIEVDGSKLVDVQFKGGGSVQYKDQDVWRNYVAPVQIKGWIDFAIEIPSTLETIDASDIGLVGFRIPATEEGFSEINSINLSGNPEFVHSLACFSALEKLSSLRLDRTLIWGDIASLSSLTCLCRLSLGKSLVQGNIWSISNLTMLRELAIEDTRIGGALPTDLPRSLLTLTATNTLVSGDVGSLIGLPNLVEMDLGGTLVSKCTVPTGGGEKLKRIYVNGTQISPTGIDALLQVLNRRGIAGGLLRIDNICNGESSRDSNRSPAAMQALANLSSYGGDRTAICGVEASECLEWTVTR